MHGIVDSFNNRSFTIAGTTMFANLTIFMQDGAISYIEHLKSKHLMLTLADPNHVISRYFPDVWPFHSPSLNPCEFHVCEDFLRLCKGELGLYLICPCG
ncbi:hypothetical protein TNCT_352381 [Trichonephila clavata]|uniref:Uncharacterized protein n=1 Tax=Trichonephila clavata TaxID=2740835 RepID=A0A8X6FGL7_TRICU|nr:hypothetical protein TNCT_352381 [Trichonephila clavata]